MEITIIHKTKQWQQWQKYIIKLIYLIKSTETYIYLIIQSCTSYISQLTNHSVKNVPLKTLETKIDKDDFFPLVN